MIQLRFIQCSLTIRFLKCDGSFQRSIAEKPTIDLSRLKDITVRAGENIKIALPIKGWPVPTASWQHGDKDLYKDDRNNIEVRIIIFLPYIVHPMLKIIPFEYQSLSRKLLCFFPGHTNQFPSDLDVWCTL